MKPFAFLMATPAYARESNCGQYNGYIVFDEEADKYLRTIGDYGCDDYHTGKLEEVTFCQLMNGAKLLDEWNKDKIFITGVPVDLRTSSVVVYGFDTCHVGDTWDTCDFEAVKARTLAWLDDVSKILDTLMEAAKYHDVAVVWTGIYFGEYSFCVIALEGEQSGLKVGSGKCSVTLADNKKWTIRGEYNGVHVDDVPVEIEDGAKYEAFVATSICNIINSVDKYAFIANANELKMI